MKYKLIILSMLLTMLSTKVQAQQKYLYTSNLEAYEGTWEYRSGDETFQLILKAVPFNINIFRGSCLVGGYYHEKHGQVLASYMDNLPNDINDNNFDIPHCPPFLGDNGCARPDCVTPNEVDFFFWDRSYRGRLKGYLTLLSATAVRFEVWEMEDISGTPRGPVSVPREVLMYKVSATEPPPYLPPVDGEHNSSQY